MRLRNQEPPQRSAIAATRDRLALMIVLLFTIVCLGAVFIPGGTVLQKAVPLVGNLLVLVVRFYFQQHEDG